MGSINVKVCDIRYSDFNVQSTASFCCGLWFSHPMG